MRRNAARNPRAGRRVWSPPPGGGCTPLVETWPDEAGPITRPEWIALYGPGTALAATGTGEATGNGAAALGLRYVAGYWSIAGTIVSDETTDCAIALYDLGVPTTRLVVGYSAAVSGWIAGDLAASTTSAATGDTQTFLIQWNATDWSVTLGSEPPVTGTFAEPLETLACLVSIGGAPGDNLVDDLTFGCTPLL